jgi:hypothetical protein
VDLTGGAFAALLALGTLAAAAAAVVFWGRLAADRPAAIAGRVGVLLGVNLLVLLTAAVVLNDTFGFFADWTDLAGTFGSGGQYTASSKGTSAASAAAARVPGEAGAAGGSRTAPVVPPIAQSGQRRYDVVVPGPVSGVSGRVVVQVPAGYADAAQGTRRYPVIETFHGYPGTPGQWLDSMDLGQSVDNEVAAGRMSSVVIVSPQLEIPRGRDTECVDGGPGLPAIESWLTVDVPNWVTRTFRVSPERSAWATAGLSAGGWCAAMAALLHPARYGAAMIFGGYFTPQFGRTYQPFGSHLPPRYDLVALAKAGPPPLAMWVETSHSDKLSYATTSAFLRWARAPLSVRAVVYAHAAHAIPLWVGLLPDALQWLESQVPGFRPAA